jgi:hypothetical protein
MVANFGIGTLAISAISDVFRGPELAAKIMLEPSKPVRS